MYKPFTWTNPKTKWVVLAFVVTFASLFWLNECSAAEFELSGGVASGRSLSPLEGEAPAFEGSLLFDDRKWDVSVGHIGEQYDGEMGDFWYLSIERQVKWRAIFLGLGLSARSHADNVEYLLPQWWNFSLSGGVDIGRFRVQYRHFSNAGFDESNRGQNWLLAGVRF
jgi:hypothetical protein